MGAVQRAIAVHFQQPGPVFPLGTTYGGNGTSTFGLPDLRGRSAMGMGNGTGLPPAVLGAKSGEPTHTLTVQETPRHLHQVTAVNNGTTNGTNTPGPSAMLGSANTPGSTPVQVAIYSSTVPTVPMAPTGTTGGQPHENMMPFQAINYCIALAGAFPPRT